MLSFEIFFHLFTDFFSSQLQTEDTIPADAFPNFLPSCFAPVLHLVMHIKLLNDKPVACYIFSIAIRSNNKYNTDTVFF